jgi:hypothetical protein
MLRRSDISPTCQRAKCRIAERTLWLLEWSRTSEKGTKKLSPPLSRIGSSSYSTTKLARLSLCDLIPALPWSGADVQKCSQISLARNATSMRHFSDSQVDVGKSVAENHRKTANNEAPWAKADRRRKRVSSKLPLQTNTARPKGLRQLPHAGVRRQQGPGPVSEEVVPVVGVVHHQTSLGVFLEVAQRRVFIPANCMTTPSQVFEVGEPVTIWVLARFAEQEGLNP